jgi:hypothetical protein
MDKEMLFADGSILSYKDALGSLKATISKQDLTDDTLIETIKIALYNTSIQLMKHEPINPDDCQIVAGFITWIRSIHNDKLVAPQGSKYPNNIVYDLISSLRQKKFLSSEETVLKFFLEGANARKISEGKAPHTDFIATNLVIDVLSSIKKSGIELSANATTFYQKYNSFKDYIDLQRSLETQLTDIKKNNFYAFLDSVVTRC